MNQTNTSIQKWWKAWNFFAPNFILMSQGKFSFDKDHFDQLKREGFDPTALKNWLPTPKDAVRLEHAINIIAKAMKKPPINDDAVKLKLRTPMSGNGVWESLRQLADTYLDGQQMQINLQSLESLDNIEFEPQQTSHMLNRRFIENRLANYWPQIKISKQPAIYLTKEIKIQQEQSDENSRKTQEKIDLELAKAKKQIEEEICKAQEQIDLEFTKGMEQLEDNFSKAQEQIELEVSKIKEQKEQMEKEIAQICNGKTDLEVKIETMERKIENLCQNIVDSEAEFESKKLEKIYLDDKILDAKKEFNKLESSIKLQRISMNQTLEKFEQSLNDRLDRLAVEPTSILAEALANDAFLQLVFGKKQRLLESTLSVRSFSSMPALEIQQGVFFETADTLLAKYCNRLNLVDLEQSLGAWTIAISLSGHIPVFKGHALRRALNLLTNHVTFGRCFDLPLSPEIISIERLFTIGQSDNPSNSGILDTAILYAATHREVLFFLVLGGLDRAPSQYFLDTLLDWYGRGLLDVPGDAFLSRHLEKLWTQHHVWEQQSLADDVLGWPPNLLLTATISGLADGFQISGAMQGQLIEVNAESQGKHLDIHPAWIDQNARKLAGEITVKQWNEWREKAQNQDVSFMANAITSLPKDQQPDKAKQEAALRVFAALCALDQSQDDALKIIQQYLLKSV